MKLKITVVILSVILLGLLAIVPFVTHQDATQPEQPQASSSLSIPQTVPTSSMPTLPSSTPIATVPTTQAPTQPTTQPATQPTTKPQKQPYSDNPKVNAFIEARLDNWICPVQDPFGEVTGSRRFATSRGGGKRAHAGLDFVAPHGTKVYAITSGTVQRVAVFYQSTWAVEVANDDGSILRYCEIATELKAGDRVEQGEIIGTIMRADGGTEMLHMEVYMGDGEGALTQSWNTTYSYVEKKNYLRRSDLLDPTFLKDLRQLT